MSRIVVNVATDSWVGGQQKLCASLKAFGEQPRVWSNVLPPGSPPHRTRGLLSGRTAHECIPYAFKAYALKEAADTLTVSELNAGPCSILWCDASIVAIRPLAPLWERIEREGYWIAKNGWVNSDWTADDAYPDLFPGLDLEDARSVNSKIPHTVGTAFGLNLASDVGARFLEEYFRLASTTRAFCGPWQNAAAPRVEHRNTDRPAGLCGPPSTLGHRHDQTAISVLAWRLGMTLTDPPAVFAYAKQDENGRAVLDPGEYPEDTILLAAGA